MNTSEHLRIGPMTRKVDAVRDGRHLMQNDGMDAPPDWLPEIYGLLPLAAFAMLQTPIVRVRDLWGAA